MEPPWRMANSAASVSNAGVVEEEEVEDNVLEKTEREDVPEGVDGRLFGDLSVEKTSVIERGVV